MKSSLAETAWAAAISWIPLERRDSLRHVFTKLRSARVDTSEINSVCLMLGPYRNLTTLTASLIALHPRCQVLNHGGPGVLGDPQLNFLADYSDEKFDRFVRFAIVSSTWESSGKRGGSILSSHAFDDDLRERYTRRFGASKRKDHIRCVFWKESLRVANQIRDDDSRLDEIFSQNQRLRFLLPIRNPMDVARSNTGRWGRMLPGVTDDTPEDEVRQRILEEIAWFLDLHDRHPVRFFWFYEHSFTRQTADSLARFLGVDTDPEWLDAVMATYRLKRTYDYSREELDLYRSQVAEIFADRPDIREALMQFAIIDD